MKRWLVAVCVLFTLGPVASSSAYVLEPVVGRPGPEVTDEFQALFSGRASVSAGQLRAFRVVFVPGFNADYLERHKGYFVDLRRELRRLGLREGEDFEILRRQFGFHGERTMAENARAITEYLLRSPRPVLLITHSKGAVDVLEALVRSREARAKVRGWFSIQSATGGTILADVLSRGWTRPLVETFLRGYGGSIEALEDLRQETRLAYLRQNLAAVEEVAREVRIVAMSTRKGHLDLPPDLRTLVSLFDPYYFRDESDGMISLRNSMIPGAPYVYLDGVDHGETTQYGGRMDRPRLLHVMLHMLLAR